MKKTPEIILKLLANRGIRTKKQIQKFFEPTKKDFNDPFLIPDMQRAVDRIFQAKERKEKIVIYGDYDVDGTSSTYILWDFLYRHLRLNVIPFIPSRFVEGYGLNKEVLKDFISQGVKLVITVDCGIKDQELIKKFPELEFIITDHHTLPDEQSFQTIAVHPGREGSKYPMKEICAAAVSFKLVSALSKKLKNKNKNKNSAAFDIDDYLPFVALATVCDVMPLIDENRAFVKLGLKMMESTKNIGLENLIKVAGLENTKLNSYHLGFVLGPRINAAGRMGDALDVVRLFSTKKNSKAYQLAGRLDDLNMERRDITQEIFETALSQALEQDHENKLLFVSKRDWHEGIIGLVAGKLSEKFNKPVVCATIIEGRATASARSIEGYNITEAISTHSQILLRFGGHSQAAGLSFKEEKLEELKKAMQAIANQQIGENDTKRKIKIESEVNAEDLTIDLLEWLEKFEPFGFENPKPIFAVRNLKVANLWKFGDKNQHIKFKLLMSGSKAIDALVFNTSDNFESIEIGDTIDAVGQLELNRWNGYTKIQMKLEDYNLINKN